MRPIFHATTLLASSVLALFLLCNQAVAITLDTLQKTQSLEAFVGISDQGTVSTAGAIGGHRSMTAEVTAGSGRVLLSVLNDPSIGLIIDHSQTLTAEGKSVIHFDGNAAVGSIDSTGLGGIDLTEDLGTAFVFEAIYYDTTSVGVRITVRIYDASDPTGETYSDLAVVLPLGGSGLDYSLPFDSPITVGPNGAANPTNIGAISIVIDGTIGGADIGIQGFRTDGNCPLIPAIGGRVLDDCGECIPPSDPNYNQSCLDCVGVPNGTTLPGDSCDTGELGPCAEGIYDPSCDCGRIINPTVERCDGADNNCNGEVDETFPQLGAECGIAKDNCEVTGAFICDDKGGVRCDIDYTLADLGDCDIEIGCDGIPGSGAVPDECGICGGDASSCENLNCDSVDISSTLFQLDGGAKEQEQLIRRVTRSIRRNVKGRKKKRRLNEYSRSTRAAAHELQIANWILSWTIPRISVQCSSLLASNFCVFDNNSSIVDEYVDRSEKLRDLGLQATKRLRKVSRRRNLAKRWRRRINSQHNVNLEVAAQVPETQAVCTNMEQVS